MSDGAPGPPPFLAADDGRPALVGARCRVCGATGFPARAVCAACGAEDTEEVAMGRRGRVRASAVVYHAPRGFQAPYLVALVELAEGPIVFCPIAGCPAEEGAPPPGAEVELVVAPARAGGAPVIQFRPVTPPRAAA